MSDYLIIRKDNLIPHWPCFVLDGYHPASAEAMYKFAYKSRALNIPSEHYFAVARQMRDLTGTPPPITRSIPLIERAIASPGGRVAFHMLNTGATPAHEEQPMMRERGLRDEPWKLGYGTNGLE